MREELNQRLRDGESGKDLVAWLNDLPEVNALLATAFAGRLITEQNLSEWRAGGYQEWLHWEKTRQLARELGQTLHTGDAAATSLEALLVRFGLLYASVTCDRMVLADSAEGYRLIRRAFVDLHNLKREKTRAVRLELEKHRLAPPSHSIRPNPTAPRASHAMAESDFEQEQLLQAGPPPEADQTAPKVNPTRSNQIQPVFPLGPVATRYLARQIKPQPAVLHPANWQPMSILRRMCRKSD